MDYNNIEKEFIRRELQEHARYLSKLMSEDIGRKKLIQSGLLSGEFVTTKQFTVTDTQLSVKFPNYGRFIEIAYHKKRRIKSQKDLTNPFKRKTKKKNTRWYTHNIFGAQNRLIGRLMYGLSDIICEQIIQDLKKK